MSKVYQIKFLGHINGATSINDVRYYQSWETFEKWWNKALKSRRNYNLCNASRGDHYVCGMEAYYNDKHIAAFRPWDNGDIPLVKPSSDISPGPALDKIESVANGLTDENSKKKILSSVAEVRNILGI